MQTSSPYPLLTKGEMIAAINRLTPEGVAYLFIIDYNAEKGYVIPESEIDERYIRFSFGKQKQTGSESPLPTPFYWHSKTLSLTEYRSKFGYIVSQIHAGNSFLVNLTQPTTLKTDLTLSEIYRLGTARYKLWLKDMFTVLSPEIFIQINDGILSSFPMKGTIDASILDAENAILNDPKEKAEHATIVDLIRNDVSMVATNVEVKRYRYIDRLVTNKGELLQVSSEITGKLPENYKQHLGEILFTLLPAGSICGAPKPKTLEIIQKAEGYERGFYTGICGWYDGQNLDSGVMIRFTEQNDGNLIYKSGGGITSQSDAEKEYEELIQKIYVPFF